MTDKKRVALLFGGRGFEHSVSVSGAKNLVSLIDADRYELYPLFIARDGRVSLRSPLSSEVGAPVLPIRGGFLTESGKPIAIDCAFPLLHGDYGEDGTVQGLLSFLDIPYVGADARASAICIDKAVTKSVAEALGIPTVPWHLVTDRSTDGIALPAFVKPDCLGSSYGAGEAKNEEELKRAIDLADSMGHGRVLVEKQVSPIRELECAYFSAQGESVFTDCGEILCDGFYSYEKKYSEHSARAEPSATIPDSLNRRIRGYARRLCEFIGIRHLARIDFFLSGDGLYFNEINTMPGMTETSLYLKLLGRCGISAEEAVNRLISDAVGGRP